MCANPKAPCSACSSRGIVARNDVMRSTGGFSPVSNVVYPFAPKETRRYYTTTMEQGKMNRWVNDRLPEPDDHAHESTPAPAPMLETPVVVTGKMSAKPSGDAWDFANNFVREVGTTIRSFSQGGNQQGQGQQQGQDSREQDILELKRQAQSQLGNQQGNQQQTNEREEVRLGPQTPNAVAAPMGTTEKVIIGTSIVGGAAALANAFWARPRR